MIEECNNELREAVTLTFKDKTFKLHFEFLDLDIDISELTQIDYSNLYGELITVSTLVNKVGILRAEAEGMMDGAKLDRDIKSAQLDEFYRKKLRVLHVNSKKEEVWKDPNNDTVSAAITRDEEYIGLCRRYINYKKEHGFIEALFWGVKDKAGILKKIGESMALTPEEFEKNISEGVINGMLIRMYQNLIK
jgi:hypothetical protein